MTSTFRSDSDLPIPYLVTKPREEPCKDCLPDSTVLDQKTKLLSWFVSHCKTESKREEYAAELSKYIPLDIFGYCGNKTNCDNTKWKDSCTENLLHEYKFYFSAENALCKEYFTGKMETRLLSSRSGDETLDAVRTTLRMI